MNSSKAASIKGAVADFMATRGISIEMEQNLVKEAIHLHLLSALSDAGVLRHVVFQGGTALRLCYLQGHCDIRASRASTLKSSRTLSGLALIYCRTVRTISSPVVVGGGQTSLEP